MNIFLRTFLMFILLFSVLGFNHLKFGNSNRTMSIYEGIQREVALIQYKSQGKELTDHINKRIKHYQKYDNWYDRTVELYYSWEELQEEK